MPKLTVSEVINLAGVQIQSASEVLADGHVVKEPLGGAIPAALSGSLDTRTSDTEGTLSLGEDHGIEDGDRIDIYWEGGSRRGAIAGTVTSSMVPFSGGSGDALPLEDAAIRTMVAVEEEFLVTGDDATAIVLSSDKAGTIVLALANNTEVAYRNVGGPVTAQRAWVWTEDRDPVNPLAGASVAKAFFSHGDPTGPARMQAHVLFD